MSKLQDLSKLATRCQLWGGTLVQHAELAAATPDLLLVCEHARRLREAEKQHEEAFAGHDEESLNRARQTMADYLEAGRLLDLSLEKLK